MVFSKILTPEEFEKIRRQAEEVTQIMKTKEYATIVEHNRLINEVAGKIKDLKAQIKELQETLYEHKSAMSEAYGKLKATFSEDAVNYVFSGAPERVIRARAPGVVRRGVTAEILDLLKAEGAMTVSEVANKLGISRNSAWGAIRRLFLDGTLRKDEQRRYFVP